MAKFDVRASYFRAVAFACSAEETRYNIGGVHIEPHPVEGVILVATDGHRMMVAHDIEGSCDAPLTARITGEAFKRGKAKRFDPLPRRFSAVDDGIVMVDEDRFEQPWLVEGAYPAWRRVVPMKFKNSTPSFNADYLADFAKVPAELLSGTRCITIRSSGDSGAALIRFAASDDLFGVLMPMRGETDGALPYFMSPEYQVATPKAA